MRLVCIVAALVILILILRAFGIGNLAVPRVS